MSAGEDDHDDGRYSNISGQIGDETFEFEARVEHETMKAYLVEPTAIGPEQVWVPKSQISKMVVGENGNHIFQVSTWWAKRAGMM